MKRWFIRLAYVVPLAAAFALEEPELPTEDEGLSLDIEPPLLIRSRAPDGSPDVAGVVSKDAATAKIESDLARARKRAAGAERLVRAGIIAQVDAEQRALKVIQLEATLAAVRLEGAKATSTREGEGEEPLARAAAAAAAAAEQRHRAEVEMALRNLQRQQKLFALGSGRKADVNRAERKLAELQGAGN